MLFRRVLVSLERMFRIEGRDVIYRELGRRLIGESIDGRDDKLGKAPLSKCQLAHINVCPFCLSSASPIMDLDAASPQNGLFAPPFIRSNASSSSLYFDAMPSMSSMFNKPRGHSRSSSPEQGTKPVISAAVPTDSGHNTKAIHMNGDTNSGEGEDDKTTLRAGGSVHGNGGLASEPPQHFPPVNTNGVVEMNRPGNDSVYDISSPTSTRKRSLSRSEDHGGATDETSLRSVPVLYTNMVPEGEDAAGNLSQPDVSQKVSVKRSPSKLVKRRNTRGKQTENLANGSARGDGPEARRSASRASQRSFRSSRGPVFDMVTAPPHATITDAGGAFSTGAVMSAPENDVEDELRTGFQERTTIAESSLTRKQTVKIQKEESALDHFDSSLVLSLTSVSFFFSFSRTVAVSKSLSKIVQSEGKTEKNSLKAAIDELKGIQKMQKTAVKVTRSPESTFVCTKFQMLLCGRRRRPRFTLRTSSRFKNTMRPISP